MVFACTATSYNNVSFSFGSSKKHLQTYVLCRVYAHDKRSHQCVAILSWITAEEENEDIYPHLVCNSCYLTMRQLHTAKEKGYYKETRLVPKVWEPHSSNDCEPPPATPRS